jgi:TonB-linked SusC/RagA family outer membrane protein
MERYVSLKTGRKLKLFMKISTFIITVLFSTTLSIAATVVKGQELLKKRVTISLKNTTLSKALDNIASISGVKFTYNGMVANSNVKISETVTNKELGAVLEQMLLNTSYSYAVLDDNEILVRYDSKKGAKTTPPVQRILTGKIVDEKGQPLPGVSIRIKGTDRGGITDINGKYQVQINSEADILVFSFVGYNNQEITAGTQKILDVKLEPAPQNELKEVAVVAYGTQRKVSLVGAQSTIDIENLKQPVSDVTTLLAGQISGVIGVQRSGEPGSSGANIWIRGIATFTTGNSAPLVLVDGIERSINNVEPEDIQSFTILKDASATAVYGVRGANGVIIVQTKRGVVGKPSINADYYEGISSFTRIPQMADGVTYMNMVNESLTTRGQAPKYSQSYIQNTKDQTDPLLYPNVNWMDAVFNKYSHNRRANVNVSGGAPNAKYYVSASYYDESGLLKTDQLAQYNAGIDYGRYNFTSNLNLNVTKSTKLDLGVSGFVGKGNYPAISASDIFGQAMIVPPVLFPVMYPGGLVPGVNPNGDQRNPYADLTTRGYSTQYSSQLYSNIRLTQDLSSFVPGLSFTTMYAYDINTQHSVTRTKREDTFFPDATTPYNADGSLNLIKTYTGTSTYLDYNEGDNYKGNSGYYKTYTESSLNYDHGFGKSHVGGLLLFNQQDETIYPATDFASSIPYRYRGLAGRVTYSYNDRYFAEVNAGYNGSENFSPDKRYGFFPAFGLGWLVSEESFFKPLKDAFSMFKIPYLLGR